MSLSFWLLTFFKLRSRSVAALLKSLSPRLCKIGLFPKFTPISLQFLFRCQKYPPDLHLQSVRIPKRIDQLTCYRAVVRYFECWLSLGLPFSVHPGGPPYWETTHRSE